MKQFKKCTSHIFEPGIVSKSVAKITFRSGNASVRNATGFFAVIDETPCIVTNNHVLSSKSKAIGASAQFFYLLEGVDEGQLIFDPDRLFWTDRDLDCTIVALRNFPASAIPLDLHPTSVVKVKKHTGVTIIGHPDGRPLSFSIGRVTAVRGPIVKYDSSTLPGSSGSPVFNTATGQVVALHNSGTKSQSEANVGCLLSSILDKFKVRGQRLAIPSFFCAL